MEKRRVVLISQSDLLGESLEHILNSLEDVQVIGPWQPGDQVVARCANHPPDLVIITDNELSAETGSQLTACLLETIPNLAVIRIKQDSNFIFAYTTQTIPARVADLIDTIRHLPIHGDTPQQFQLRTGKRK
jgi:DNA-binding NarL/FixJ family response regulator